MSKTPHTHVVRIWPQPSLLGRITEDHPSYLGNLDGGRTATCGVQRLENATRYTKRGAERVARGYSHAEAVPA